MQASAAADSGSLPNTSTAIAAALNHLTALINHMQVSIHVHVYIIYHTSHVRTDSVCPSHTQPSISAISGNAMKLNSSLPAHPLTNRLSQLATNASVIASITTAELGTCTLYMPKPKD